MNQNNDSNQTVKISIRRKFLISFIFALLLLGFLLIFLNIYGITIDKNLPDRADNAEFTDMPLDYYQRTKNIEDLRKFFERQDVNHDLRWLEDLTGMVAGIIVTGKNEIAVEENWLLYLLGRFSSSFQRSLNGRVILRSGVGNCTESVFALRFLLDQFQMTTRRVGLRGEKFGGHDVLEVKIQNQWVVADPTFGFVLPTDALALFTDEGRALIQETLKNNGFPHDFIQRYPDLFSTFDNTTILPEHFSTRIARLHKIGYLLKWLIPYFFIFLFLYWQNAFGFISKVVKTNINFRYVLVLIAGISIVYYLNIYEINYRLGAWTGEAHSQFNLALLQRRLGRKFFVTNKVMSQAKFVNALRWLEKAAQNDYLEAQYALGIINYYGFFLLKANYEKAFYWLSRAAKKQDPVSLFFLDQLNRRGPITNGAIPPTPIGGGGGSLSIRRL